MIRVRVVCEGQTEVQFINDVLRDSFSRRNIYLFASLLGKPGHKGGNVKFARLLTDVRAQLRQDKIAYCTSFFDFYGLSADFPGKREAQTKRTSTEKADCVLRAMTAALRNELGDEALRRFVPYIQMHEFEGLLFSDPAALAKAINSERLRQHFEKTRSEFKTPEDINDSPQTSPSKRIGALFKEYDKPTHGLLAAKKIGLDEIRNQCPLFNDWLMRIDGLQSTPE